MLSPRALGWSIMAVAVALLIMAFEPGRRADNEGDRDVARATGSGAEATPHAAEAPAVDALEKAGDRSAAGGEAGVVDAVKGEGTNMGLAAEAPAGPSFIEAPEPPSSAEPGADDTAAGVPLEREGVAAKPGVLADGPHDADRALAHKEAAETHGAAQGAPPVAEMPPPAEEPAAPAVPAPALPPEPGGAVAADSATPPPVQPGAEQPVTSPQEPRPHQLAANGHRREVGDVEGKGPHGGFEFAPGRGGGPAAAGRGAGAAARLGAGGSAAQGYRVEPSPDDAVLLVHCDVSPGAAQSRAFDRLLVDNGIRWEQAKSKMRRGQREQDLGAGQLPEIQKKQEHEEQYEQRALSGAVEDEAAGPVELVYVEASLAQIESTLASLNGRPGEFLTVSVKPAPGMAWQKGFSYRYNREPALEMPTPDEPPGSVETAPGDRPDLHQSKAGLDAPEGGGRLSVDGFAGQQTPGSQSEPKAAPIQPGEPAPLQVGRPAPVQTEQTAEAEPAERSGPPAEAEGTQELRQPVPGRPSAEGPGVGSSRLAGPHGRAQRLPLPGEEPAAEGEAPGGLRSRAGQGDAYRAPFGGLAPGPPRKAPGAYPEPSARPAADKKLAEQGLYRVLFVLRVVPPADMAGQAIAADGPAARAAEAAVEAMPAAVPEAAAEAAPAAEPPPNPAAGEGPLQ